VLGADAAMCVMTRPYLHADQEMVRNWRGIGNYALGVDPLDSVAIGICTKGSARSERASTRDLPDGMLDQLHSDFGPFLSINQGGQFDSFADTAAVIANLDLVITVDTAVAHLAGAMGVPVWLLLSFDPDFRWGLRGTTTLWYPSMRIFRQPRFRDWDAVIVEVRKALLKRRLGSVH
jgi:hypothetical protein